MCVLCSYRRIWRARPARLRSSAAPEETPAGSHEYWTCWAEETPSLTAGNTGTAHILKHCWLIYTVYMYVWFNWQRAIASWLNLNCALFSVIHPPIINLTVWIRECVSRVKGHSRLASSWRLLACGRAFWSTWRVFSWCKLTHLCLFLHTHTHTFTQFTEGFQSSTSPITVRCLLTRYATRHLRMWTNMESIPCQNKFLQQKNEVLSRRLKCTHCAVLHTVSRGAAAADCAGSSSLRPSAPVWRVSPPPL